MLLANMKVDHNEIIAIFICWRNIQMCLFYEHFRIMNQITFDMCLGVHLKIDVILVQAKNKTINVIKKFAKNGLR